ncbi:hypothetical protein [Ruminococcus albus]|uniref:Uncharacterized protein n=1 Tax=Ruminococcus albus TaxID=1264 RepID=A0A1I1HXT9_RUMAL|nr:hypothetical protein [Ruminococcus albus]SFC28651.1 hypothetical protein SAMN02910406_01448 [Ruminococcus albus]
MKKEDALVTDIERNKELFEYEMTEVLIKLKGEFATVKGEDVKGDNIGMTVEKPNIELKEPKISVDDIHVDIAEIPKVAEVKPIKVTLLDKLLSETSKITAPGEIRIAKKDPASPKQLLKDLNERFDIPEISITCFSGLKKDIDRSAITSKVEIPSVNIGSVKTGSADNNVSVTVANDFNIPGKISAAAKDKPVLSEAVSVGNITVPEIKTAPALAGMAVKNMDAVRVKGTDIPAVKAGFDPDIKIGVSVSVAVPDLEMPKPDIEDFKSEKAKMPAFPDVPEKPDFSGYIEDILNSFKA